MSSHPTRYALGFAGIILVACSASSERVGEGNSAISAGQIFNFGALAHSGSCLDAQGSGDRRRNARSKSGRAMAPARSRSSCRPLQAARSRSSIRTPTSASMLAGAGTATGTRIQLFDCNGTAAQSFNLNDAGERATCRSSIRRAASASTSRPAPSPMTERWCSSSTATGRTPSAGTPPSSAAPRRAAEGTTTSRWRDDDHGGGSVHRRVGWRSAIARATSRAAPTDGSCFSSPSQVTFTMCKDDPSSTCTMGGTTTTAPAPAPPPAPAPVTGGNARTAARTVTFVNQCSYDVWVGGRRELRSARRSRAVRGVRPGASATPRTSCARTPCRARTGRWRVGSRWRSRCRRRGAAASGPAPSARRPMATPPALPATAGGTWSARSESAAPPRRRSRSSP